ncbi:MAG: hypothetical protein FVQ83_07305 [Chloroflexi bacterium]|nr:hypothetical protein [Chloroflexota bacterium]
MGRTIRTTSHQFQKEIQRLKQFKQALSPADKRAFDDIFALVQPHLMACGYVVHEMPMLIYIFSILLEMQKEITNLEEFIQEDLSLQIKE